MSEAQYVTDSRIINGGFLIDQRNEGAAVTPAAAAYVCDMWKFETTGLGSALTLQVQSSVILPPYANSMKILTAVNTAPSAAQFSDLSQIIEGSMMADLGWGTDNAVGMYLSFSARASVAGTYYVSVRNSANNRSYVAPFVISVVDKFKNFRILIPGDVSGTWLKTSGTVGARVSFDLGSGSNFNTAANAWAAGNFLNASGSTKLVNNAAATLYLTTVYFTKIPISTPYCPRPYAEELLLCRRFFRKSFAAGVAPAQNTASLLGAVTVKNPIALGDPSVWVPFDPPMSITPTITTYNPSAANANWRDITAAADVTVSVDPGSTLGMGGVLIATSGTVTTLGDILGIHYAADAGL